KSHDQDLRLGFRFAVVIGIWLVPTPMPPRTFGEYLPRAFSAAVPFSSDRMCNQCRNLGRGPINTAANTTTHSLLTECSTASSTIHSRLTRQKCCTITPHGPVRKGSYEAASLGRRRTTVQMTKPSCGRLMALSFKLRESCGCEQEVRLR